MMRFLKLSLIIAFSLLISCNKDDDNKEDPPRDEAEVYQENEDEIQSFLENHFYYIETDSYSPYYKHIVFDSIAGDNADETPLIEDENLKSITVKPGDVEYTLYFIQHREGDNEQYQPTFADKITLTYKAANFEGDIFDETKNPKTIDIPQSDNILFNRGRLKGTVSALQEFYGASDFEENPDGTISYEDDYGIGAIIIPSGLGYFEKPPLSTSLQPYEPFVFTFEMFAAVQMDHDGDGIPSYMEDLNGNGFLDDDDTDNDGTPNYLDDDDDGDGTPTRDEIIIHEPENDWYTEDDIEFPDSNDSGTPDYLDPEVL